MRNFTRRSWRIEDRLTASGLPDAAPRSADPDAFDFRGRAPRVALITEACAAGVGRHVLDLAEGLHARGSEVHLIDSPQRADAAYSSNRKALSGVHTASYPFRRGVHAGDAAASRFVAGYLRDHGPFQVVHGHSSKGGALARIAAIGTGARVVYTPHALITMDPNLGRAKRLLYSAAEWSMARLTDAIVAVSPEEYRFAIRAGLGRSRVRLVANGVGPYDHPRRVDARRLLGLPESSIAVGFVGRLADQKAPDVLLRAFALASSGRDRLRLVVVGNGPLGEPLKRMATELGVDDRVLWLGEREGRSIMPALDVLAVPSRYEGLPYVGLEALAASLPVVATESAGMELIVTEGINGRIVPVDDPSAFAEALARLADDPARRASFGRASRARAAWFSADRMVDQTLAVYFPGLGSYPPWAVSDAGESAPRVDRFELNTSARVHEVSRS